MSFFTSTYSITLKPGREKSLFNFHPWLYSGSVAHLTKGLKGGELVAVYSHDKNLLAYGHYEGEASLVCRLFCFTKEPQVMGDNFWHARFKQALCYRQALGFRQDKSQKAYRLFYSEGDELPGLIVDIFGSAACIQIKTLGMDPNKYLVVDFLRRELSVKHIFYQSPSKKAGEWILGGCGSSFFKEAGLTFEVEIGQGQKTGYFLDQRDNRRLFQSYAQGKTVLDAFCYTGGFGLMALQGQARQVEAVDISQKALDLAQKTAISNFGSAPSYHVQLADCFEYLRQIPKQHYDLIALDPPAFAKEMSAVAQAARGYKDVNLLALKAIKSGGILFTFSCSQHISWKLFRQIIFAAAKDAGRFIQVMHQLAQAPDHPVNIYHPQGEYLKGLVLYVV